MYLFIVFYNSYIWLLRYMTNIKMMLEVADSTKSSAGL